MPSSAGTVYFALGDNEWSVRDWIAYGSLVDHVIYDSFGKIYSQSNTSVPFAFMHNSIFYDPATGLEYHSQAGTGYAGRWYNPSIQRWMSEDPTGLAAGPDQYEYCNNSPTNFVDPSGLEDYRTKFLAECKNMPKDWQVHHIIEQGREIIAERFKAELGEDIIDSLDNLRGIDRSMHGEISAIQNKFWNAQATKYGSKTEAYKKIPLDEVRALQAEIKATYGSLWIEAKATAEEIAAVQKAVGNARMQNLRPGRVSGTLKKVGIVLTGFAIFAVISDNVSLGCNILDPPAHVQAALDKMLRTYVEVYNQADTRGFLKREDWTKLQDATMDYMKVAGYEEKIRAIMFEQFTQGGINLP